MTAATRVLAVAAACGAAAGCVATPRPVAAVQFQVGGVDVASKDAESQMILFQTPDDVEKFCLAPPPDAVPTTQEGVSLFEGGVGIGENAGEGAAILGGRGQAALIAREVLYRTCELSLNYHLDKDEAVALYQRTLALVEVLARSHLGPGSVSYAATAVSSEMEEEDEDEDEGEDDEEDLVEADDEDDDVEVGPYDSEPDDG